MIKPTPCSRCKRRALARASRIVIPGVSSTEMGAWAKLPTWRVKFNQSSSRKRPVRNLCRSTLVSKQSSRWATCCLDISRLKIATGTPASTAALRATPNANDVFPTLGRAARIIKSPACRPDVKSFSSLYPVSTPDTAETRLWARSMCSNVSCRTDSIFSNP